MSFSFLFPLSSVLLLSFGLVLYLLIIRPLFFIFVSRLCSPLRLLPCPPSPSLFIGNLAQLADQENSQILHSWIAHYGHTFTYRGFLNAPRLFTIDPQALAYILGHAYEFPKPDFVTDALAEMGAGHDGLLTAQGDVHKRQVCFFSLVGYCRTATSSHSDILSAGSWCRAFSLADPILSSSDPMPIATESSFLSVSHQIYRTYFSRKGRTRVHSLKCPWMWFSYPFSLQLRDIFAQLADVPSPQNVIHPQHVLSCPGASSTSHAVNGHNPSAHQTPPPSNTVDVLAWLGRATLDVIGQAGTLSTRAILLRSHLRLRIRLLIPLTPTAGNGPSQRRQDRQ
jgi:hypothetical protein